MLHIPRYSWNFFNVSHSGSTYLILLDNQRITKWMRLKGTYGDSLVQPPCSKQSHGVIALWGKTLHFPLLNFMRFLSVHFPPCQDPSSTSTWVYQPFLPVLYHPQSFVSSQFCIHIHKQEGTVYPIILIINWKVKQYRTQYICLGYTTSDWSSARLCATDRYVLSLPVQTAFSSPCCPRQ